MSNAVLHDATSAGRIFAKQTLHKGQPTQIRCAQIDGRCYTLSSGPVSVIQLEDEWYEDIEDPEALIRAIEQDAHLAPDLLTFWQRIPETEPRHPYYREADHLAVLPVRSYEHWWNHQIKSRVRTLIRKSEKSGVSVKRTAFDDDFVAGMTAIFNETPVRQGRKFWHYGKDADTIRSQFSRYLYREHMIGAYFEDQLIGFMMLGDAGRFGITGQIISSIAHRDKAPNNALIAKAVEVCEALGLEHLVYLFWSDDSLAEFKRRCGFERVSVPRYYVPLTWRGAVALKLGLHRGWKERIPPRLKRRLKQLRSRWHEATA